MRKTGSARSTSFPESTSGRSVCLQHIGGSRFTRETNEIPSKEGEEEENICGQGGDLGVNKGNTQPVVAVETAERLPVQLELRNEVVEEGGRRLVLLNASTIPHKKERAPLPLCAVSVGPNGEASSSGGTRNSPKCLCSALHPPPTSIFSKISYSFWVSRPAETRLRTVGKRSLILEEMSRLNN